MCHVVQTLPVEDAAAFRPAHPYPAIALGDHAGISQGDPSGLMLVGLQSRATDPMRWRLTQGVVAYLRPGRLRYLSQLPSAALNDKAMVASHALGLAKRELDAMRSQRRSWAQRVLLLEQLLRERLHNVHMARCDEIWSAVQLHSALGAADPVARLSRDLGVSARSLQRSCASLFGVEPSFLLRVARFHDLLRHLSQARRHSWSLQRLASELGYSDASHLCREARLLGGSTPNSMRALLHTQGLPPWLSRERASA